MQIKFKEDIKMLGKKIQNQVTKRFVFSTSQLIIKLIFTDFYNTNFNRKDIIKSSTFTELEVNKQYIL